MNSARRDVLIGIDLGTTMLKAAAFDGRSGRRLGQAQRRLAVEADASGKREQTCGEIDAAMKSVLRTLRGQLGERWKDVAGIGLAAQGGSGVIVDRESGRPHTPMRLWNDLRFMPHLAQVAAMKPDSYWRRIYWRDGAGWGLGRLRWLRQMSPRLFRPANLYAGAGEYVFFRLTGTWRQDACNALQIGCYDVPQRRLADEPLRLVGVDRSFVAPLRAGHELAALSAEGAQWLSLPAGLPVAGPYIDHEAGYMAAAGVSERPLQLSLGTAWVGNFILPRHARWTSPFQLVIPSPINADWQIIQPLLTGNVTWDWAMEMLLDGDRRKAIGRVKQVFDGELLPSDGLVCLPWLNMPNPIWPEAVGGGTFFGVSATTGREQLLRAVAAGMCYETRRIFEQITPHIDCVVLGGGASKGAFFRRLLAALFAPVPVRMMEEEDWAGTRGTLYAFNPAGTTAKTVAVPAPPPRLRSRILAGYDRYRTLFDRLYGQVPAGGAIRFETSHAKKGHV